MTDTSKSAEPFTMPSLVNQIANLDLGESVSKAIRLDGSSLCKQDIEDRRERLRNTIGTAVSRATAKTGGKYILEGGEIFTRTRDLLIVQAITRLA